MKRITLLLFLSSILLFSSCRAYKKVGYLKNAKTEIVSDSQEYTTKIFPKDLLTIVVNTNTPEAAAAFNMPLTPSQIINNTTVLSNIGLQTYLVEADGTITFPVLGKIPVAGKTKKEVEDIIKNEIYPKYITEEPIINIRFVNFKISILGEVTRPGNFSISNERVSIFDALAMAGDLTLYGKRDNIILLRENEKGGKETYLFDLQDKNIINSPYFYLQQNDVIYVEPNKHKANASAISTGETLSISITSTLISLSALLVTVFK